MFNICVKGAGAVFPVNPGVRPEETASTNTNRPGGKGRGDRLQTGIELTQFIVHFHFSLKCSRLHLSLTLSELCARQLVT